MFKQFPVQADRHSHKIQHCLLIKLSERVSAVFSFSTKIRIGKEPFKEYRQ